MSITIAGIEFEHHVDDQRAEVLYLTAAGYGVHRFPSLRVQCGVVVRSAAVERISLLPSEARRFTVRRRLCPVMRLTERSGLLESTPARSTLAQVATVSIQQADGTAPFKAGSTFTLEARVDPGRATAFQWKRNGEEIRDQTNSQYQAVAGPDTAGKYTVVATVDGQSIESAEVEVKLADAATPEPVTEPGVSEPPPEFHLEFAVVTAIVGALLGTIVLWRPASAAWHLGKSDWKGADGDRALAASLSVPLTVIGGSAVVLGAWMALVEWRGRFKKEEPAVRGFEPDVGKVIEAVGKLRGAALVMVVGALLMLGGAWVAQSSVEEPPTTTTTTTTTATTTP